MSGCFKIKQRRNEALKSQGEAQEEKRTKGKERQDQTRLGGGCQSSIFGGDEYFVSHLRLQPAGGLSLVLPTNFHVF